MNVIKQNDQIKLIQVVKTVDWLVKNTSVNYFDPIKFTGYQRKIDLNHCEKIVKYLEKDFYMPSSIICATEKEYSEYQSLRIVDGQHRVEAFKMIFEKNRDRYNVIKDNEISVVVIENASEDVEINTFITINKTSKKVDTSLAYVLKNKTSQGESSLDLKISKREYISVELAQRLNTSIENKLWFDKIIFEGNPKDSPQLISLNAFVKSMRGLLYYLELYDILSIEWENQTEIETCLNNTEELFNFIWFNINMKWPMLFSNEFEKRRIIQGAIGLSSINKFINLKLKKTNKKMKLEEFKINFSNWINNVPIDYKMWEPGGKYSLFSSESGYSLIAREMFDKSE